MATDLLNALVEAELAAITASMTEAVAETTLSAPIRAAVLRLLSSLEGHAWPQTGGSETQESSKRIERIVLDKLGVPVVETVKAKKKGLCDLPMLFTHYLGFKRVVERRNECRFVVPEADGVYAIHQPFGSQANPDILLIDVRGKAVVSQFGIEIKSGGQTPTWNTHIQSMSRNLLYIAVKKEVYYFFGEHVRDKQSLALALAWDELQRKIAGALNEKAAAGGHKNYCVPYPKQEFRGLDLSVGRDERHAAIRAWLSSE